MRHQILIQGEHQQCNPEVMRITQVEPLIWEVVPPLHQKLISGFLDWVSYGTNSLGLLYVEPR